MKAYTVSLPARLIFDVFSETEETALAEAKSILAKNGCILIADDLNADFVGAAIALDNHPECCNTVEVVDACDL